MNLASLVGLVITAVVIWFGVISHSVRPMVFIDLQALTLVVGGTAAAALLAFPFRRFRDLFAFLFMGVFFPTKKRDGRIVEQILSMAHRPDVSTITHAQRMATHPFLMEGFMLMQQAELTPSEFKMIVNSRRLRFQERYGQEAKLLTALAKFPPAFGLLGAIVTMVTMMQSLTVANKDSIGPALAAALVSIFWGIGLANFIFLPLADHAQRLNVEDGKHRLMIATGLILISNDVRPVVILEHLLGFLPVAERITVRASQTKVLAQQKQSRGRIRIVESSEPDSRIAGGTEA